MRKDILVCSFQPHSSLMHEANISLVTKEEPAWESFSEDEPVAKAKPASSQASQKKKPAGAKAGQGSIMSFFAKKT